MEIGVSEQDAAQVIYDLRRAVNAFRDGSKNWPADLLRSEEWPNNNACRVRDGRGHYCTLAVDHRGDHVTILTRWPRVAGEETVEDHLGGIDGGASGD